jgi:hypothetical protein
MSSKPVDDSQYWRDRANTTRAKADQTKNDRSKRMLRAMAAVYERAAEQIEQRLRDARKSK